jgi:hypothetical protein
MPLLRRHPHFAVNVKERTLILRARSRACGKAGARRMWLLPG